MSLMLIMNCLQFNLIKPYYLGESKDGWIKEREREREREREIWNIDGILPLKVERLFPCDSQMPSKDVIMQLWEINGYVTLWSSSMMFNTLSKRKMIQTPCACSSNSHVLKVSWYGTQASLTRNWTTRESKLVNGNSYSKSACLIYRECHQIQHKWQHA